MFPPAPLKIPIIDFLHPTAIGLAPTCVDRSSPTSSSLSCIPIPPPLLFLVILHYAHLLLLASFAFSLLLLLFPLPPDGDKSLYPPNPPLEIVSPFSSPPFLSQATHKDWRIELVPPPLFDYSSDPDNSSSSSPFFLLIAKSTEAWRP